MFKRVMVANRGEIAVRVFRTLRDIGIESVAVASEADAAAAHVLAADESRVIGPANAAESYLNIEKVLAAAKQTGCEAIHPGYGFLSENAAFAEACHAEGIVFIGPPVEAIASMGSKTQSRSLMEAAKVPVVPGYQPAPGSTTSYQEFSREAENIGYPVLVKASAGGGGKGMRAVHRPEDLKSSLNLAQTEALAAFGDDTVYLEKLITKPRHIEVQIFADTDGNTFYLGERECSIQRRHQKILEECPSAGVNEELRQAMGAAAVQCAKAVKYRGAGTVEFLLDESGEFYFLEMNTRLQVEHPVTEMVYGVDLVRAQLQTAAGDPLDFNPQDLRPRGHAVEARIYAEDPGENFMPQTGPVLRLEFPQHPGVRVDSGLLEGRSVEVHYDPLLAKVVAWAPDRTQASHKLRTALEETVILGVGTNQDFLVDVLSLEAWLDADLDTGFLEHHLPSWSRPQSAPPEVFALAGDAAAANTASVSDESSASSQPTPWTMLDQWRPLK